MSKMNNKKLLTGNEAAVLGAIDAGAEIMFSYPITPATEIFEGWVKASIGNKNLQYLQTEDETAAGFGVIGAIAAGVKSFTATAGPGHVLMQDPLGMAENLRLPFVGIMMQRGGPSTGTVNFSQQELNLAAFGGNGDGLRIVYSASTILDMYKLTIQAFDSAWKFKFPTMLLGDGYLGKMRSAVELPKPLKPIKADKILKEEIKPTHLKNCYSSEEEFGERLEKNINDWKKIRQRVALSETHQLKGAKYLIVAHGLVAEACREAVDILRKDKKSVGLFRAITLHPFDNLALNKAIKGIKKIFVVESSLNQFARVVKYELYPNTVPIVEISRPAQGFTPFELSESIKKYL